MSGASEGEPLVAPLAFMKTQGCQGLAPWRASNCHVLCYHLWECQNHRPEDRVLLSPEQGTNGFLNARLAICQLKVFPINAMTSFIPSTHPVAQACL